MFHGRAHRERFVLYPSQAGRYTQNTFAPSLYVTVAGGAEGTDLDVVATVSKPGQAVLACAFLLSQYPQIFSGHLRLDALVAFGVFLAIGYWVGFMSEFRRAHFLLRELLAVDGE